MFRYTWPFPQYDEIIKRFPDLFIDKTAYANAKDFYLGSLEAERNRLNEFIRTREDTDTEREFINNLILNALHVGIGHTKGKHK